MMMYGGRNGRGPGARRARHAAAARVGLTDTSNGANGTSYSSAPPPTGGPGTSPRALMASARTTWSGFRRVLRLVWDANPGLTLSLAILNLLQGAVPAA